MLLTDAGLDGSGEEDVVQPGEGIIHTACYTISMQLQCRKVQLSR